MANPLRRAIAKFAWRLGGGENWFQNASQIPPYGRLLTSTGSQVTLSDAIGLPAVAGVLRLIAETSAIVPLCVYEGQAPERDKARDSWQWHRLHDQPNDETSAFDFFQDIATSVETAGNAFVWKAVSRRPIQDEGDVQLFVMDPLLVRAIRDDAGRKRFMVRQGSGPEKAYTSREILHVRGWTGFLGAIHAPSPIALHRLTFGTALDREEYEGAFFRNNGATEKVFTAPDPVSDEEAQQIVDRYIAQHTGVNSWRPAFVSGGARLETLGVTQQDAQYIEQKQFSLEDIARIFHVTALGMLRQGGDKSTTADDFERFLKVDLAPRLRRVEMAFQSDRDLFPEDDLFAEFLTDAVLRPDIKTRYEAYRLGTQGGWITGNEIREKENLPPHPQGEGLQETPVGGAPNPTGQQPSQP